MPLNLFQMDKFYTLVGLNFCNYVQICAKSNVIFTLLLHSKFALASIHQHEFKVIDLLPMVVEVTYAMWKIYQKFLTIYW
jgi:hypothetical protein